MDIDTQIWLLEKIPWIIGLGIGIYLVWRFKRKQKGNKK